MKKNVLFFLLLNYSVSFSQTLESLKPLTKKICDANYNMDFEPVAELTYPSVVKQLGGREKFIEKLDNDYQNVEFRKRLQLETPVFSYSEIKQNDGKKYCVITYYNPIRYFYENKMDDAAGQKTASDLKIGTQATQTIWEPKRNSINVKRNSKLIAISDPATNNEWRFINLDDLAQREILNSVLNENIKKEFGL